jgi:hypothetical protein
MNHDRTNSGALFKNDKQGVENRPDYRGKLNVNGTEFYISAWLKADRNGNKYMSLSVQPKNARPDQPTRDDRRAGSPPAQQPAFDDDRDVPF